MTSVVVQSLPICLVVSLTMVALEEDDVRGFLWHGARHFASLYGGVVAFSLGVYLLDAYVG